MFYLSVWQNEIILAMLGAGTLLMLGIVLTYLEFWRPRGETASESSEAAPRESLAVWFLSHVSWILVVIAAGAGIWGLLYAIDKIVHPPIGEQAMIGHEEHRDIPQWLSWTILVLLTGAIVSWCMFLMMLVMDPPREWDFGAFQDVPGQSVYSTRPALTRFNSKIVTRFDPNLVPLQMPKLPEARRSPKLSETAAQPGGARP